MSTVAKTERPEKEALQTKPPTIRDRLSADGIKRELAMVLPKHVTPERMIRVTMTALTRTPDLANCDQPSFFKCLLDLSAWGLEPDGRRAHLIPFWNTKRSVHECQLIIDYKGIVELIKRSGDVASIYSREVCEGDYFRFINGVVTHQIDFQKPRGKIYAFCSQVTFKDGTQQGDVMTMDEVSVVWNRSKAKNAGPWKGFGLIAGGKDYSPTAETSDAIEMAKKTVFRRLSKLVPWSSEVVRDAVERDDDQFEFPTVDIPAVPTKPTLAGLTEQLEADAETPKTARTPQEIIEATEAKADKTEAPAKQATLVPNVLDDLKAELDKLTDPAYVEHIRAQYIEASTTKKDQTAIRKLCALRHAELGGE